MNRRFFLGVVSCALGALPSPAQLQQRKVYRIGYLHPTDSQDVAYTAFIKGLEDLGYVIGGNTIVEERFAEGRAEQLPAMAAELVARHVDIIVAVAPTAIRAARAATQTIPIVMAFSGDDPVKSGFAATLARPGGNTTGVTAVGQDLAPKWIELLRDLVPGLNTIGVLRAPGRADHAAQINELLAVAERIGIRLQVVEARDVDQYADALNAVDRSGSQAVVVLSGPEVTRNRVRLVALVTAHRLPSVYQFADFALIGGLASYGPDIGDLSARAAAYVDKILNGANPAELPIEQPRRFFLVINRRTANTLGLRITPALLLQADQVIE
jgi:putative tryptophan/tyrosine transport system substrate-binding protein